LFASLKKQRHHHQILLVAAGGDNPVGLYIDGGIFFGVCLGLFYGVKKLLANK